MIFHLLLAVVGGTAVTFGFAWALSATAKRSDREAERMRAMSRHPSCQSIIVEAERITREAVR